MRRGNRTALGRAALFARGGAFAFVFHTAARSGGLIDGRENAIFGTVVTLSMAISPLVLIAPDRLPGREAASLVGGEAADRLRGQVLMIGVDRFGQIALQVLPARGAQVSVIEPNPERIRAAEGFGFRVHSGDGTRLDILRSAGAADLRG